jgi:hypothetical protein
LSVLHANGAGPLTFCASATRTSHPEFVQRVVDEPRAVHRLDHPTHKRRLHARASRQAAQAVGVGRRLRSNRACNMKTASSSSLLRGTLSVPPRRPSFIAVQRKSQPRRLALSLLASKQAWCTLSAG